MSLKEYKHKRNFQLTPEPAGAVLKKTAKQLQFVIQKHDASHLHYDFRLEMEGVLRSWAIPKGPSLNPSDKRLSVQVEDHPISYGNFEGHIPQGQYGGGEVIVWDNGTWECEGDPIKNWKAGKLKFELHGKKLKGKWLLLRTAPFKGSKKENWLLRKENDEYADSEIDITAEKTESVISGKKLEIDLAENKKSKAKNIVKTKSPSQPKKTTKKKTKEFNNDAAILNWHQPQLATLVDEVPTGPQWLYEMKYDGYRILAEIQKGKVILWTRHHNDWTERFNAIAKALKKIKVESAVFDGEVVVLNAQGQSDFQALQNNINLQNDDALHYYIFDLLVLDNKNITQLPLLERKKLLQELLSNNKLTNNIHFSDHLQEKGKTFYKKACAAQLEGIMAKRADKPYHFGRNDDWVKIKCNQRQEFVIGGFTEPAGSRVAFGALLLGYYDEQRRLHYAGKVGTGFTVESLRTLHKTLKTLVQDKTAFINPPKGFRAEKVSWLKPTLIAEVEFSGWTSDKRVRHPAFRGLREDKTAGEVRLEKAKSTEEIKSKKTNLSLISGVKITHPDKVIYPDSNLCKLDVVQYYDAIAKWLLPYLKDRPLNILRCPEGISGANFFQKHLTGKVQGVEQVNIEQKDKTVDSFIITDKEGLINLAQQNALEFHVWGDTVNKSGFPDQIIFDLDPEASISWQQIIESAFLLRNVLSNLALESFVKTTGGKGLHIVVPIKAIYSWDQIHHFAKAVATTLVKLNPDLYTATATKAKRTNKIFIDYLRNSQGATAVAPYSLRARPGAPVATPLSWEELNTDIARDSFTLVNIFDRLNKLKSDLWAKFFTLKQILSKEILKKIK